MKKVLFIFISIYFLTVLNSVLFGFDRLNETKTIIKEIENLSYLKDDVTKMYIVLNKLDTALSMNDKKRYKKEKEEYKELYEKISKVNCKEVCLISFMAIAGMNFKTKDMQYTNNTYTNRYISDASDKELELAVADALDKIIKVIHEKAKYVKRNVDIAVRIATLLGISSLVLGYLLGAFTLYQLFSIEKRIEDEDSEM